MMTGRMLLLVALQLAFRGVLAEEHCAPCQQVDCSPLPSNCKYGVTLDHCGCCNICVQSKGERCTFLPNSNGVGFLCHWSPVSTGSELINNILSSQFQRPTGLNTFFRAFFKIPKELENVKALNAADKLGDHATFHGPQDNRAKQTDEYYKKYPTCGLFDYLTTEATDGNVQVAKEGGNNQGLNVNSQLLNAHSRSSIDDHDSKRLISEAEEFRKAKEEQKSKYVLVRTGDREEEEALEKLKSKIQLHKQKQISAKKKRFSIYARQHQNINDNLLENGNNEQEDESFHEEEKRKKVKQELQSTTEKVVVLDDNIEGNEDEGKEKEGSFKLRSHDNSLMGIKKHMAQRNLNTDPASQLLAGTISDIMKLFINSAKTMHAAHEDARGNIGTIQRKPDPVALLRDMIERKHQMSQYSQYATNMGDIEISFKDSSKKVPNGIPFSLHIDDHNGIYGRKIVRNEGSMRMKGNAMDDEREHWENEFNELNPISNQYENRQGIQRSGGRREIDARRGSWRNDDSDNGENEWLERDWDENNEERYKDLSLMKKPPLFVSRLIRLKPGKYFLQNNMFKHKPQMRQGREGIVDSDEANEWNRKYEIMRRKKRNTLKPGKNADSSQAKPFRYGSFTIDTEGQFHIKTADVGKKIMEDVMNDRFPGRLAKDDEK